MSFRSTSRLSFALGLLGTALLSAPMAFAYRGGADMMDGHDISVGGGIASPSGTSAIAENPAGLIYNNGVTLLGEVASDNSSLNPIGAGGIGFLGNGTVAAALGVQTFDGFSGAGGNITQLDYGLAANLASADVSLGVAGTYLLHNSGITGTVGDSPWGLDAGAIFNAHGTTRFGATVYNLTNGVTGLGAGIAYDFNPSATFVTDFGSDQDLNGKTLKPGLQVRLNPLQLAVSYGIDLDNSGVTPISRGLTLGLGARMTESLLLIAYYNELATYYLGLSLRF